MVLDLEQRQQRRERMRKLGLKGGFAGRGVSRRFRWKDVRAMGRRWKRGSMVQKAARRFEVQSPGELVAGEWGEPRRDIERD